MSSIPNYGIVDNETGQRRLSRNRRFNHHWYSSKKLDYYDNRSKSDYAGGLVQPINNTEMLKFFFVTFHGAIQTL